MTPWYETRKPLDADGFEHRHPLDWWEQELASMPAKEPRLNPLVVASRWFLPGVVIWTLIIVAWLRWFA